jgi:hypothetical protein
MAAAAAMGCGMTARGALLTSLLLTAASAARAATTYYVTVAGLGGEPEYESRFTSIARELDKVLRVAPDAHVDTLEGDKATRAALEGVLQRIGREAKADDTLVLMMVGHGSFDGVDYKFNLPGPDISAVQLGALLDRVPARQLVVNMSSASGAALAVLRRENRVVVTATKSGNERNATVFARYWLDALRDAGADADKNETISAIEAFRYANRKTQDFYESQKRLATEHALLEDTGHGDGARDPAPANGEGLLAARIAVLRIGVAQLAARTPEKQKLLARKEELEAEIDRLKYQKAAMPFDEYRKKLGVLVLELAQTQAEIDK